MRGSTEIRNHSRNVEEIIRGKGSEKLHLALIASQGITKRGRRPDCQKWRQSGGNGPDTRLDFVGVQGDSARPQVRRSVQCRP